MKDLLTQVYPTVSNEVSNSIPYKAVANVYPTFLHCVERSTVSSLQ